MLQPIKKITSLESMSFLKDILSSAVANVLALAISMIGSILLTRALGAEGRGLFAWVTSLSMIAMGILQFGLGQANRRFVAKTPKSAGDMILVNISLSTVASLIVLPFFAIYGLTQEIGQHHKAVLIISLLTAPLIAITTNLGELLLGLNRPKQFNLFLLTQRTINCLLVIAIIIAGIVSPYTAVLMLLISYVIQMLLVVFCLGDEIKNRLGRIKEMAHSIKSYIAASYVSGLSLILANALPPIFIASMHSLGSAGLFAACMILIDAARSSIRMIGMHVLPKLSSTTDTAKRKALIKQSLLLSLLFSSTAAIIFYLSAEWVLALLFGDDFTDATPIMRILSFGLVFSSLFNTMQAVIAAIYKGFYIVIPGIILVSALCVLSLVFIPIYGAIGGAAAWFGASSISFITSLLFWYINAKKN